ncbi:ribosome-associated GTPase EngA, partial [Vibrio parahaemolyticus VP2007-007]
KQVGWSR